MAFQNLTPGIQNLPGLVNQSKAIGLQEAGRRQQLQRMDQQQFSQFLMSALGFMQQGQQMEAQQGQQTIDNERADAQLQMQQSESAAKLLQMGKDLELSDAQLMKAAELQGLDAEMMQAQIDNVRTGTAGEEQRQEHAGLVLPAQLTQQRQAIDLGETQGEAAALDLQTQREVAPHAAPQAAANVAATEQATATSRAKEEAIWTEQALAMNPPVAGAEKWQKGIQEEFTGMHSNFNSSLQSIDATLANQTVLNAMLATDGGEQAITDMVAKKITLMRQLDDLATLGRDMAAEPFTTEQEAWSYFGDRRGAIMGGTAPIGSGQPTGTPPQGSSFNRGPKR